MWKPEYRAAADRRSLRYPSDLTDAEWALVAPLIPPAKHGGRKRTVNVRDVLNAIFYVLATGKRLVLRPQPLGDLAHRRAAQQAAPALIGEHRLDVPRAQTARAHLHRQRLELRRSPANHLPRPRAERRGPVGDLRRALRNRAFRRLQPPRPIAVAISRSRRHAARVVFPAERIGRFAINARNLSRVRSDAGILSIGVLPCLRQVIKPDLVDSPHQARVHSNPFSGKSRTSPQRDIGQLSIDAAMRQR